MKVYIVNVNNCEAYSDYYEGNRGVYPTYQQAVDAMTAQGFDPSTKVKIIPCYTDEDDWFEEGWYDRNEYRIEEWEMDERTCKQEERGWGTEGDHARVWLTCGHSCMVPTVQDLPNYCPNCGCKVVGE